MLISMLVNHMKVRVKYAYMLNKSSLDMSEEIICLLPVEKLDFCSFRI